MYVDNALLFSDVQVITAAAASTNYMDAQAVRDLGTGQDLYLVVTVDTAFTDSGSDSTLSVSIYGDSATTFTPDASDIVITVPAVSAAGTVCVAKLNPGLASLQYRYIELYYTPNGSDLTAGAVTAFITTDVQKYKAYANNYTITG